MNALVTFRANAAGNLAATNAQRAAAAQEVSANLRAKLFSQLRNTAKQAAAQTTEEAAKTAQTDQSASAKAANTQKAASTTTTTTKKKELDRDAFLQLLVTQMQYQDPLDPVDNTEMIAQLAQFSSLEQMTNLNTSFTTMSSEIEFLSGNIDQLNFISAQGLLGKYVEGVNSKKEAVSGIVSAVTLKDSIVVLTVGEGTMPMTGVTSIADEAPSSKGLKGG